MKDATPNPISLQLRETASAFERKQLIESWVEEEATHPNLVPALIAELQPEGDEITTWAIIRALGKCYSHQPEIMAALIHILEKGRPPSRRVAVEVLSTIGNGNQDLISSLVQLAQREQDEDLRFCIAKILGGIGQDSETARNGLIYLIHHSPNYETRKLASDALAQIDSGSPEAIEAWLHLVQTGEDYYIRYPSMQHLSQFAVGNPLVIQTFKTLLNSQGTDKWSEDSRTIARFGLSAVNRNAT